jgi:hypothetical protein
MPLSKEEKEKAATRGTPYIPIEMRRAPLVLSQIGGDLQVARVLSTFLILSI